MSKPDNVVNIEDYLPRICLDISEDGEIFVVIKHKSAVGEIALSSLFARYIANSEFREADSDSLKEGVRRIQARLEYFSGILSETH